MERYMNWLDPPTARSTQPKLSFRKPSIMAHLVSLQSAIIAIILFIAYRLVIWLVDYLAFKRFERENNCSTPKYHPRYLPYALDRVAHMLRFKGDILDDLVAGNIEKYGLTHHNVGIAQNNFITVEPENVKAVLSTRFKDYELGDERNGNFGQLLGHGIFTSDGPEWERFRALLRPQFAREQISDLESSERHIQVLFRAIESHAATDEITSGMWTEEIDLQECFSRHTMDVSTEFLFGASVDTQTMNLSKEGKGYGDQQMEDGAFQMAEKSSKKFLRGGKDQEEEMGFADAFLTAQDISEYSCLKYN
jgi:cytochrome P450